ncbi:hypothetical protein NPIL_425181 [Nephila pilipes]|uniref:Uncharacterized protein n=1 Tax=Nephila pilipes TaxID=299642 RepID=A0A8X6MTZ2_NEPPI|nr:hypothetical protein NPIL_425181 [Nephila pilipes]
MFSKAGIEEVTFLRFGICWSPIKFKNLQRGYYLFQHLDACANFDLNEEDLVQLLDDIKPNEKVEESDYDQPINEIG